MSLSHDIQTKVIDASNSTSRYLDDLLNIDNNFFDSMGNQIYPSELQLNKNTASFLDLHLSISDDFLQLKFTMNERILILILLILDGDVPRSTSEGVKISQLIRSSAQSC